MAAPSGGPAISQLITLQIPSKAGCRLRTQICRPGAVPRIPQVTPRIPRLDRSHSARPVMVASTEPGESVRPHRDDTQLHELPPIARWHDVSVIEREPRVIVDQAVVGVFPKRVTFAVLAERRLPHSVVAGGVAGPAGARPITAVRCGSPHFELSVPWRMEAEIDELGHPDQARR